MNTTESLTADLRRLYSHFSRRRRWQLAALVVLMLLGTLAEITSLGAVLPFLALLAEPARLDHYAALHRVFSRLGAGQGDMLIWSGVLFGVVTIVAAAVRTVVLWAASRFSFGLGADIGVELYRRTLYRPYTWHVSRNSSDIIAGIQKVDNAIFNIIMQLVLGVVAVMMSLAIIATLLTIDPTVALMAVVGFTLLYGATTLVVRRNLGRNSKIIAINQGRRLQAIQEGLGGIRDVLLNASQNLYSERFASFDYAMRRAQSANNVISSVPRIFIEATGMALIVALAYGLSRHLGGLAGALPVLGALALGAQKLLPQMQAAYVAWSFVTGNSSQLNDILELLDTPIPAEYALPRPAPAAPDHSSGRPLLVLRDVGFHYAAGSPRVLNGINLEIPHGARIGIVGPTGSGKSTLIDVIMALLPPSQGQIEIEGEPLTPQTRLAWQARIAHVPQAIFLSDTSIAENIALGTPPDRIDRARMENAARQAQLSEFIETLPQSYQTKVGERGVRLSGGQRQRIGLARALYKQTDVLVLDEATSALDDATESDVMDAIRLLHDKMTVLIVAHRISTLRNCDWIIQFGADGQVHQVHYEALSQPHLKTHSGKILENPPRAR